MHDELRKFKLLYRAEGSASNSLEDPKENERSYCNPSYQVVGTISYSEAPQSLLRSSGPVSKGTIPEGLYVRSIQNDDPN